MKNKILCCIMIIAIMIVTICGCSKKSEEYVVKIGEEKIPLEEALWYVVILIDETYNMAEQENMKIDESFWESAYNDDNTMADYIKSQAISIMAKHEVLSKEAKKSGKFEKEGFEESCKEEAKEYISNLDADLKKIGIDEEGYITYLEKEAYRVLYHTEALALYDIDEESVKENNPYSEDKYESKEAYDEFIKQKVQEEKESKFQSDYKTLEEMYGIDINEKVWDTVNIKEIASYIR